MSRAYSGFRQHCRMQRLVLTKDDLVQRCDAPGGKYYTCHVANPGDVVRRLANSKHDCSADNFHKYILAQKTRFECGLHSPALLHWRRPALKSRTLPCCLYVCRVIAEPIYLKRIAGCIPNVASKCESVERISKQIFLR